MSEYRNQLAGDIEKDSQRFCLTHNKDSDPKRVQLPGEAIFSSRSLQHWIGRLLCGLAIIASLNVASSVMGASWAFNQTTILWDTLTITRDPGLNIVWTDFSDPCQQTRLSGWMLPADPGTPIGTNGWYPLADSRTTGPMECTRTANDSLLGVANSLLASGNYDLQGSANRSGTFVAQGNGSLTVQVGFSTQYQVPSLPSAGEGVSGGYMTAQLFLGQYMPSPTGGGGTWVVPYAQDERIVSFSKLGLQTDYGVLGVTYTFSDTQIGHLDITAAARLSSIPEPTSVLVLLLGAVPIVIRHLRRLH